MPLLLIIEDDLTFSLMLSTWLKRKGFEVHTTTTLTEARKLLLQHHYALVLSDIRMPDGSGIELLDEKKNFENTPPFIMMTSYAEIQSAVQSMKLGASDYIAKPVNPDELLIKINENIRKSAAPSPTEKPAPPSSSTTTTEESRYIVGNNPAAVQTFDHARLVAPTDMSVLITGASGTGKEYVARYIHENSLRKRAPFVAVDCGAIPRELAASEFFGHVKGSFTGAVENKTGAFVAAKGGTIFLDEIGNLTYEVQVQLLRALQERKIKPIGSNQEISIDIRLVSATNENLREAITNRQFREDLFHRINEFTIRVPALQERKEDIITFAEHFLREANRDLNKQITGFAPETIRLFESYAWPGNLRQLKNVVRYATLLASHPQITPAELPEEIHQSVASPTPHAVSPLKNSNQEREMIVRALAEADNNKSKAAQLLGIDRKTLYNKLKLYGLN